MLLLFLLISFFALCHGRETMDAPMNLIRLNDSMAVCLDGSQGA